MHNFLSFNLTFLFWIYIPENFILEAKQQLFNKVLPRAKVLDAVKFASYNLKSPEVSYQKSFPILTLV